MGDRQLSPRGPTESPSFQKDWPAPTHFHIDGVYAGFVILVRKEMGVKADRTRGTDFLSAFEHFSASFQSYQLFLLKFQEHVADVKIGAV